MVPSLEHIEDQLEHGSIGLSDVLVLRRMLSEPFRRHPLGFLACTLIADGSRKLRLHYWPIAGGAQQSTACQIHDHIFDFKSWVLAGSIENIEYIAAEHGQEMAVYQAEYSGDCSTLIKTDSTLKFAECKRSTFGAGMSYSVPAGVLHETVRVGIEPAFTALLTKDASEAAPLVLGPLEGLNRYVYKRTAVDESVVEEMFARAERFARRSGANAFSAKRIGA